MKALLALLLATAAPVAAMAEPQNPSVATPAPVAPARTTPPKLLVVIAVDQFSSNLFNQYRGTFTGGFARLLQGVVFPAGYQAHAATETCPGHATILTGVHPATSGIIANNWVDQRIARADKTVYCAEDERVPGSTHDDYTPSDVHLKVPTLGDLMKRANPASRVVSVAGKDRAAIMMGGHSTDQLWFWNGKTIATLAGRPTTPVADRTSKAVANLIAQAQPALPIPAHCTRAMHPVAMGEQSLGAGRFARAAGDARAFRTSPELDASVFAMAAGFIQSMKLGQGKAPDLIAIGASATDYVGHAYGPGGGEMCLQLAQLDAAMGAFFDKLDEWNIDYEVVLTADHGGHDATERQQQRAMPTEARVSADVSAKAVGAATGKALGIAGPVLLSSDGDLYVANDVPTARRDAVIAEVVRRYRAMPQIAAALTGKEIAATPIPQGPPEDWTLIQRARASYDPARSGDVLLMLKSGVLGIARPGPGYVATHGTPWDYDRRVPIVFWRKGMVGFEQPSSVETVDIAPTLAATIGLKVTGMEGRCLDLDVGAGDSCK